MPSSSSPASLGNTGGFRVGGGLRYQLDPRKTVGSRISALEQVTTGKTIDPAKSYVVAGWGSVADKVEGPPVWDVIEAHLGQVKSFRTKPQTSVRLTG